MDIEGLRSQLKEHKQEHLLQFWDRISEEQKKQLYNDLKSLDFAEINEFFTAASSQLGSMGKVDDKLEPVPTELCGSITRSDKNQLAQYEAEGKNFSDSGQSSVLK